MNTFLGILFAVTFFAFLLMYLPSCRVCGELVRRRTEYWESFAGMMEWPAEHVHYNLHSRCAPHDAEVKRFFPNTAGSPAASAPSAIN